MDATRFWLDRGVDGFRLDVFNAWYEHAGYPDNPPKLGLRGFDRQHHIYDADQPEMHPALAELRGLLDAYPQRASVGELFGDDPGDSPPRIAATAACTWSSTSNSPIGAGTRGPSAEAIERADRSLAADGWPCYVLSNHDLPRHVTRYGGRHPDEVARVAAALLLTQRGTPFVYYGEEIGLPRRAIAPRPDRRSSRPALLAVLQGARPEPKSDAVGHEPQRRVHQRNPVAATSE